MWAGLTVFGTNTMTCLWLALTNPTLFCSWLSTVSLSSSAGTNQKLYKIESGNTKKQKYHISLTKNESCKTSKNKNRIHYQRLKKQKNLTGLSELKRNRLQRLEVWKENECLPKKREQRPGLDIAAWEELEVYGREEKKTPSGVTIEHYFIRRSKNKQLNIILRI